jgi:methylated-DNA-[protein]-cysteine S-methyltransferase
MPATCFDTPIGSCAIAWSAEAVTGFSLPPVRGLRDEAPPWVQAILARVKDHLEGKVQDFADLPYAWNCVSSFQRAVYQAALKIKAGQTSTYGELAAAIGQPISAARAIGTALGQNPWPLLIPCHRFVGLRGRMTGFSAPGGTRTKLRLLALEGVELFAE